jgi:16S rRNA U1498 N3-methylase RsmE
MLPEVLIRRNLWAFITKEADDIFPSSQYLRVVAHPMKQNVLPTPLSPLPTPPSLTPFAGEIKRLLGLHRNDVSPEQELVIAIGGEGGWHDTELKLLQEHCFQAAHLGPRVLRSDTAVSICYCLCYVLCLTDCIPTVFLYSHCRLLIISDYRL